MSTDAEEKRVKSYKRMRATLHVGMGLFYLIAGFLLVYAKHFGAIDFSAPVAYTLGILMFVYGTFRVWRGMTDMRIK
jgi:hypothetical protein